MKIKFKRGRLTSLLFALSLVFGLTAVASPANASTPFFQMPFLCGETWKASTYSGHNAIDWNAYPDDNGRQVVASAGGTASLYYESIGGYQVIINHGGGWQTVYAHMQEFGRVSGEVTQGQPIGKVGGTGNNGNGYSAHLHWEQKLNGVKQPTLYANGAAISPGLTANSSAPSYTSNNCGTPSEGPSRAKTVNTDFNRDGVPDIYAVHQDEPGTTVRVINGANPQQWLLQDSTLLGTTGSETEFAIDDYNRDGIPDIYAIQRNEPGSNSTAVRIINGANRQQWLLQSGTILGQTGQETSFSVADYNQDGVPDIYAIQRNEPGSNSTAVRIINGANPQQWLLQSGTVLGQTGPETEFEIGFYDSDNVPDIYAIQRNEPGSNSTAVRIINGANPQQWLLQSGTVLGQTNDLWDFKVADRNGDGKSDLYAFNRNDTGSGSTSVHIVTGAGLSSWLLQSGTLLSWTDSSWQFN